MASSELRKGILRLAARREGVGTTEVARVMGVPIPHAAATCRNLRKSGKLLSLRLSHKCAWYFVREADLKAYTRPAPSAPAQVRLVIKSTAFPPDAITEVPAHVKVQVCPPSAPPRFESHEFPFIKGWRR